MAKKSAGAGKVQAAPSAVAAPPAPRPYVVFARRFRPQTFHEVVGQESTTVSLKAALRTGRLAQAYLLSGPRGVGKTSLARIFAKALNCLSGGGPGGVAEEPCNKCEACEAIQEGRALDVIEMDAATHRGIEDIRELRANVGLAPAQFRFKVYIVDEVHMLTIEAWNAFLKTLEEPPAHVKFVFATTDAEKIPETIISRCQRYDLRRIGLTDIVKRLEQICTTEKLECEHAALERIAGLAKGGLRDAESFLDQAVNLGGGKIADEEVRRLSGAAPDELIFEILTACARGEPSAALARAGAAIEAGADPDDLLGALSERLRGALVSKTCGAASPLLEGQSYLKDSYTALGALLTEDQILMLLQLFAHARRQVKEAAQARLPLEIALVRAARARDLVDLGILVAALESGAAAAAPPERPVAREGPRPNFQGRPAGAEARPAAEPRPSPPPASPAPAAPRPPSVLVPGTTVAGRDAGATAPAPQPVGVRPERWNELLAAIRVRPGGAMVAMALTHAVNTRLDLSAGVFELSFKPAQGFYVESLERPERAAALKEVLAAIYGRDIAVNFLRVQSGTRVVPPPRAARAVEPREALETEVEFTDEGALPLPPAPSPPLAQTPPEAPAAEEDAEAAPVATAPAPPDAPPEQMVASGALVRGNVEALEHPLVKLVVGRVKGQAYVRRGVPRATETE